MYLTGKVIAVEQKAEGTRLTLFLEGDNKASFIRKKEIVNVGLWLDDGRTISALQRKKI